MYKINTIKYTLLIFISLFFISCGGGSSNSEKTIDFNDNEKEFLHNLFKTKYLYKDNIQNKILTLDYNDYNTSNEMIKAYRYDTLDKWSYAETFEQYEKRSTQVTSGFGCIYKGKTIKQIRIDSPCYNVGLKRGDQVILINDKNITKELYNKYEDNLNNEVKFTVKRYNYDKKILETLNFNITPKEYIYKVSSYQIITRNRDNYKIGHFIYDSFTAKSTIEIDKAFDYFKSKNIQDIIIDLRYNGGGSINTASYFLDKLVKNKNNSLQFTMKYNNNYQNLNKKYYFIEQNNSIDFKNIIFLTTNKTASSSELLINSLKPYTNVSIIGTKSRGKPVGMKLAHLGDKIAYWLINFSMYNANDIGDYYEGLDVNCEVNDEIYLPRDNANDKLLISALKYLDTNTCN